MGLLRNAKFGFSLTFITLLLVFASVSPAFALSGGDFSPGRIIDDSVFFDPASMSVADIQAFLNSKVPVCDTNHAGSGSNQPPFTCLKDYVQNIGGRSADAYCSGAVGGGVKSAAQIIKDVSVACSVNPKVLIVLLQKEQSLVTDTWPWNIQYERATGYGCPDTAPCDPDFAGFFNQVWYAARQYQRYAKQPGSFIYRSGYVNYIQFNPNAGCGGTNVSIENQATAGLYNYTPYQPNGAALNNLYGTGDSCSSYGNRNFWRLFNDWFGKTVYATALIWEPAVVSQTPGKINIFARGADRRQWQDWYSNGAWETNWNYIDGPSPDSSAPSAISWGNGHMDVFETRNGSIWHSWYNADSTGWRWWSPIGKPAGVSLGGTVAAVSQAPGKINLFARGTDGRLWQTWYDNGNWQSWNYIEEPTPNALTPSAVSWANGHMDIFEIRDGNVWHSWYNADSTGWRGWSSLGRPSSNLTKSVSVVSQAPGKLNMFGRGEDGVLWQNWYANGNWQNSWNYIDGASSISSAPTAFSWADGHMDVFEIRAGSLWHSWYNADSTGWREWQAVGRP